MTINPVIESAEPRDAPQRLLLRPTEAAVALGISRSKCYELIASGDLPSIRLGNVVRIPLGELQRWIDSQVRTGRATGRERRDQEDHGKPATWTR